MDAFVARKRETKEAASVALAASFSYQIRLREAAKVV
jgi:hypothetical protein